MKIRTLLKFFAGALVFVAAGAQAQQAFTAADTGAFAGPGDDYPYVADIDQGYPLYVYGCVGGYTWCDVGFDGNRGWVDGRDIEFPYGEERVAAVDYGPRFRLPLISFTIGTYWNRYYTSRPFYGDRTRWEHHAPPPAHWEDRRHVDYRSRSHDGGDYRRDHDDHRGDDHRGDDHHGDDHHGGGDYDRDHNHGQPVNQDRRNFENHNIFDDAQRHQQDQQRQQQQQQRQQQDQQRQQQHQQRDQQLQQQRQQQDQQRQQQQRQQQDQQRQQQQQQHQQQDQQRQQQHQQQDQQRQQQHQQQEQQHQQQRQHGDGGDRGGDDHGDRGGDGHH